MLVSACAIGNALSIVGQAVHFALYLSEGCACCTLHVRLAVRSTSNKEAVCDIMQLVNARRYAIMMGPVRADLAALCAATIGRAPETPHEAAFAREFAGPLSEAVAAFAKAPPGAWFDFRKAAAAFEPLRKLLAPVEARTRCADPASKILHALVSGSGFVRCSFGSGCRAAQACQGSRLKQKASSQWQ